MIPCPRRSFLRSSPRSTGEYLNTPAASDRQAADRLIEVIVVDDRSTS